GLEGGQRRAGGAAAVRFVARPLTGRGRGAGGEDPAEIHLAEGRAVGRRATVQARIERGPATVTTRGGGAGTLVPTGRAAGRLADAPRYRCVAATAHGGARVG